MSFDIRYSATFKRSAKLLAKKYPSLKHDLTLVGCVTNKFEFSKYLLIFTAALNNFAFTSNRVLLVTIKKRPNVMLMRDLVLIIKVAITQIRGVVKLAADLSYAVQMPLLADGMNI
jgi:hypothetical protein